MSALAKTVNRFASPVQPVLQFCLVSTAVLACQDCSTDREDWQEDHYVSCRAVDVCWKDEGVNAEFYRASYGVTGIRGEFFRKKSFIFSEGSCVIGGIWLILTIKSVIRFCYLLKTN